MQVTVSDKGQITLPHALRQRLGIESGMRLDVEALDDGSLRVRVLARGSRGLHGLLSRPGERTRSLDEIDQAITDTVRDRKDRA
ncbi:AbrB/MazE/SpoVT family DNA-binding domain-containing protein [Sphaerotilus sp.]|uniref:AbrB/MazE/SpoVT family DNA-binding domain-containing protein n=1 Tax=Sphaerotilus sp. TaxID=2093942 RepID=UPI002ACDFF65|nr:AbrB/MazE/SpoVT family DNA-binding domain-containing protein [Sphaerotilus sp.]MDZ7857063.1 AbrB/MazE/SpoVT family DNA-binding domain-containing protein [Sphaerotilus sp.]